MSTTLPESGLPVDVDDEEPLARFLFSSSLFNSTGVKPAAFLPNPKNGETSVFRHGSEPEEQLWPLARDAATSRTLHGAAIVKASYVRASRLTVTAHEPPARHANILGWPDSKLEKSRQKLMAAELSEQASLVLRQG